MGEWQTIKTEIKDRVAVLTVDHPPVNSFNTQVVTELGQAMDTLLADDEVKVIIITGGGSKAFIAGADIPEMQAALEQSGGLKKTAVRGQMLFLKIEQATKPVIAAINGFCLGGGMELAMACHMRICSDKAKLGQPEINLGIIPGWGGTQRLPRLVNKGKAIELILTGDMLTAQDAYQLGLVNRVVPHDAVLEEARNLAEKIASKSKLPTVAALRAIAEGLAVTIEEGLKIEADEFGKLESHEDTREGVSAFLEKRPAQFKDQ